MTCEEFTRSLEAELRLRGVPFERAALQEFVDAGWPLIEDNPDLGFWLRQFLEALAQRAGET
jgi:hypothetical protein